MCQSLKNPCKALEVNRFLRCFNVFSSKHLDIQRFWFILNKFISEHLNNPWIKVGKYLLLLFNIQEPLWMQIIKRLDKLKTDLFQMVGVFFTFLVGFFSHFWLFFFHMFAFKKWSLSDTADSQFVLGRCRTIIPWLLRQLFVHRGKKGQGKQREHWEQQETSAKRKWILCIIGINQTLATKGGSCWQVFRNNQ